MGRPAGWMQRLTGQGAMRLSGAPSHRHEVERAFWQQIATGITSEKAAEAVGVPTPVGTRWFRHRGGMPLLMSKPVYARYLSFTEREEIALLRAQDVGVREMAGIPLGVAVGAISAMVSEVGRKTAELRSAREHPNDRVLNTTGQLTAELVALRSAVYSTVQSAWNIYKEASMRPCKYFPPLPLDSQLNMTV